MHAFIVSGGTEQDRTQKISEMLIEWKVAPIDQVRILATGPSIGITEAKQIAPRLLLGPFQSNTVVAIIHHAETLTTEAQNAILKNLEEPPRRAKFILETELFDRLLPTIISRCQHISLPNKTGEHIKDITTQKELLLTLTKLSIGKRMAIVDPFITNRESALSWLLYTMEVVRPTSSNALELSQQKQIYILRTCLSAYAQLHANVTPKLVMDSVLMAL